MDDVSRLKTYIVGRDGGCDVRLDDPSVSRRHAEVVRVEGGRLYVTDCATINGTYVLAGREWRAIRQAVVEPTDRLRFGELEMGVGRLDELCPAEDAHRAAGGPADYAGAGLPPPAAPGPIERPEFDPETGELIEKAPRRRR